MPSDVDERVATEEYDAVEGKLQYEEESWWVGAFLDLLARAVAEKESSESTKPKKEGAYGSLQNLVESSHIYIY